MNQEIGSHGKAWEWVAGAMLLAALAWFAYWYFYARVPEAVAPGEGETTEKAERLGEAIFEGATNPLGDKLPEAQPNIVNPLEGAYKNPFR